APTVRLTLDFLSPVRQGDWVQGEIALVKLTERLAFTQTVLTVDGASPVRTSAMFSYSEAAASLDAPPPRPPIVEAAPPPDGFEPLDPGPGFGAFFGPMHWRPGRLGFRVAQRHINLFGVCHGGALAMFADYQIALLRRAGLVDGPFTPTLSLSVDF